jgi:hypothetical protein
VASKQELEILLKARNLSAEAFRSVEASVSHLGDQAKKTQAGFSGMGTGVNDSLKSIGAAFPPAVAQADAALGAVRKTTSEIGQYMAGAFTVGAVVSFGKTILAAGDQIQRMADQTSLGTAEVQKLQYISSQTGPSVESLVGAVQNLQQRLGEGDAGAVGALKRLNINLEDFEKLNAYEQMSLLSTGIRGVEDPTQQAAIAADLFGRSWKEILPAIKADMEALGNQAPIMSQQTVESLDRIGDALGRVKQQAIAWGGSFVLAIEGAGYAAWDFFSKFNPEHFGVANSELLKLAARVNDPDGLRGAFTKLKPPVVAVGEAIKATAAQWSAADIDAVTAHLNAQREELDDTARASKAYADEVTRLRAQISGAAMQDDLRKLVAAWRGLSPAVRENELVQRRLLERYQALRKEIGPSALGADFDRLALKMGALEPPVKRYAAAVEDVFAFTRELHKETLLFAGDIEPKVLAPIWDVIGTIGTELPKEVGKGVQDVSADLAWQFGSLADQIAMSIGGAFGGLISSAAQAIEAIVANAKDKFSGLAGFFNSKTGKGIVAGAGIGVEGFGSGYGAGAQMGSTKGAIVGGASGALSGMAAGAAIGAMGGPIGAVGGAVIGGIAGVLGGIFGGAKKKKEEAAALKDARAQLVASFGDMENLRKVAASVGVSIDQAFSTKSPKEFESIVGRLNDALEKQKRTLEGLAVAAEGLNLRVAASFTPVNGAIKGSAEEFERLGVLASGIFARQVKETGDVISAIGAIGPSLELLAGAQASLGVEASGTFGKLLRFREIVETNKPVADSLSALNQIVRGLAEAGGLTREELAAVGQDAAAQFAALQTGGASANEALALMAPTLQVLWEQQKKLGGTTDETTAALLRQAEEQGVVGARQQDVNQQILDVLLSIADVFGAKLPAGLRTFAGEAETALGGTVAAARAAAGGIEGAFAGIRPTIYVDYEYEDPEAPASGAPHALGGSVPFSPGGRLVRVAERQTERIVSDDQLAAIVARAMAQAGAAMGGSSGPSTVVVKVGERELRSMIVEAANDGLANGEIRGSSRNIRSRA